MSDEKRIEDMKALAQRIKAVEELLDRADPVQTGIDFLELKRAVEDLSERLSTLDKITLRAVNLMEQLSVKQLALETYLKPGGAVH